MGQERCPVARSSYAPKCIAAGGGRRGTTPSSARAEPKQIATALSVATEEVEKALVQMRSPRPETTRGTLNVTLAAH